MGYGGLRAGEVGGLRAEDVSIEPDRCRFRLRQQVVRLHKSRVITSLKTGSSRRTVAIPCPDPMHMVARPNFALRSFIA